MSLELWSVVLTGLTMLTLVDGPAWVGQARLMWKHRQLLWNLYRAQRSFSTLNQLVLVMSKEQMGLPYTFDETPWKTYLDVKTAVQAQGAYWPYLTRLDSTTTPEQQLTDQHARDPPRTVVNFSSYSYAGALREAEVVDFTIEQLRAGHYAFGNHGPRMLGGNNYWIDQLEQELARFTGREAALVYSSGFLACKTVLQAVVNRGDVVFGDGRLHESLRDGLRCAVQKGAKSFGFRHNDWAQLEGLLKKHRVAFRRAYVVVESVYSMDGDFVDLAECQRLAEEYDCRIILDEAHGLGVVGKTGRGVEELQNCRQAAWLVVGSLTKAFGSVGGYVCGSREIVEFLHFFSTGTMFSAPLSVPNCIAAYKTVRMIDEHPEWLAETDRNMDLLRALLAPVAQRHGVVAQSSAGSPLVALVLKDFSLLRLLTVAQRLRDAGFYVAAVNAPACPLREPRLRLTAPRGLTPEQIRGFVVVLDAALTATANLHDATDVRELAAVSEWLGL